MPALLILVVVGPVSVHHLAESFVLLVDNLFLVHGYVGSNVKLRHPGAVARDVSDFLLVALSVIDEELDVVLGFAFRLKLLLIPQSLLVLFLLLLPDNQVMDESIVQVVFGRQRVVDRLVDNLLVGDLAPYRVLFPGPLRCPLEITDRIFLYSLQPSPGLLGLFL